MKPEDVKRYVGENFVHRQRVVILSFAGKTYDRYQLAKIGIPHTQAARNLHLFLQKKSIKTAEQLATEISTLSYYKGIGTTAFYAALALLEAQGAKQEGLRFYAHSAIHKTQKDTFVTFATLKTRNKNREKRHAKKRAAIVSGSGSPAGTTADSIPVGSAT